MANDEFLMHLLTLYIRRLENLPIPVFAMARPEHGMVIWPENIDVCPDSLYVESVKDEQEEYGKFL